MTNECLPYEQSDALIRLLYRNALIFRSGRFYWNIRHSSFVIRHWPFPLPWAKEKVSQARPFCSRLTGWLINQ